MIDVSGGYLASIPSHVGALEAQPLCLATTALPCVTRLGASCSCAGEAECAVYSPCQSGMLWLILVFSFILELPGPTGGYAGLAHGVWLCVVLAGAVSDL